MTTAMAASAAASNAPRMIPARDGFSFSRAVQNAGSELMNRNPPIMRLQLHWLRYDLAARATPSVLLSLARSRLATPAPSSSSPPCRTRAPTYICAPRKCHIRLMDTYVTCVARARPHRHGSRDCRRETNYFPEERARRCHSLSRVNRRGSAIFLARRNGTHACERVREDVRAD